MTYGRHTFHVTNPSTLCFLYLDLLLFNNKQGFELPVKPLLKGPVLHIVGLSGSNKTRPVSSSIDLRVTVYTL